MKKGIGLFIQKEVQSLIDSFAYCFKVRVTVFSGKMEEVGVGLRDPGALFCRLVQNELGLLASCRACDRVMCARAAETRRLVDYRCHAGLLEAVLPIKEDDAVIGFIMIGQLRDSREPAEDVLSAWRKTVGDDGPLLEAYARLASPDRETRENMYRLFSALVDFIMARNYIAVRRGSTMETVAAYVRDHLTESFSLGDAARSVGKAPSTVSRAVRRESGMTFKRFAALKRAERFELEIDKNPSRSIADIAESLGYADPLYFSRVYKGLRGFPPSAYGLRGR